MREILPSVMEGDMHKRKRSGMEAKIVGDDELKEGRHTGEGI